MITNREIAKILFEMAAFFEMQEVEFKPRAYEGAALGIESLDEEVVTLYKTGGLKRLMEIPGVGKGIAEHLEELYKTGHFKEYEALKKKVPVRISELVAIEGVGPKMVKVLWEKLGIRNLLDLERAARAGRVRKLPHFGIKSEEKILKGIAFLKQSGGRRIMGTLLPEVRQWEETIRAFPDVEKITVAGSIRRRKETIGDIDIVVVSSRPAKMMERFLTLPDISHVYGKGLTKMNVKLKNGLDADVRVVPPESFGAALNYFTGSKNHNIKLREIAIKKGFKLNEYGLFRDKKMVAGKTEEEIYKRLGLEYIEPEMREDTGEIEGARLGALPKLVGYKDLKGDLQVQTDWTDGEDTIERMAEAAQECGLEYIAITDHTKSLAMTSGADEKKLLRQKEVIEKLDTKFRVQGFRILTGAEVNIMKDGSLDIADAVLRKLDVVGAAVHSHFKLSRDEQTKRVIRAMENPHVDIIFHLTGRIINRRGPIEINIKEVIKVAKQTGTVLEINAYPDRSDLKDEYIRMCVEAGVRMAINSDAHAAGHFKYLEHGIAQARRGWATRRDIINAWPREKMLKFLKNRE